MKKTRDKLPSLHLFISCRQNSQELTMVGAPNRKLPKTVIKLQMNSEVKQQTENTSTLAISKVFPFFDIFKFRMQSWQRNSENCPQPHGLHIYSIKPDLL